MQKKILIIDDEKGIQDLFKFLLEPKGFQVFTANDGLEGVEMVKKDSYDVIFLDVHMPRMTGPEALKKIKQMKPNQVVVIFSSSSDPNFTFESEAKQLGAYTCIYKPVDISEILDIIDKAIKAT
ncbi:MAG: response regulator [Elusimicrobia bacterium]|nr:response regulator [Elusimicrobiota bacterium]